MNRPTVCWMSLLITLACTGPLHAAKGGTAEHNCSPARPERFVDFFPTFAESKGFALGRTVLPLPVLHWHDGIDTEGRQVKGPDKAYLSSADYWKWPSLNQFMREKDLLSTVKRQDRQAAVVDVFKDGTGGIVSFHFKVQAGCWFLWQYEVRES